MLCALSIIGQIYFDLGLITQCTLIICFCLGFFSNAVSLPDRGALAH